MDCRELIEGAERLLQEARIQASRSGDRRTCEDLDRAITFCLLAEGSARRTEVSMIDGRTG